MEFANEKCAMHIIKKGFEKMNRWTQRIELSSQKSIKTCGEKTLLDMDVFKFIIIIKIRFNQLESLKNQSIFT